MGLVPFVVEQTGRGERQVDIFSRLLTDRIIFIGRAIDEAVVNLTIAQLLFLEAEDPDKDIYIYINSPGGVLPMGLGIYDTIQYIKPAVSTICMGQAASLAALLLCAGTKGKRSALPNSRIMIHQPLGGSQGQASDLEIYTKEILTLRKKLNDIMASHTGQSLDVIARDTDRNFFMSAEEAKQYGIIDEVIYKKE